MSEVIAVDGELTNIRQYLEQRGYEVTDLDSGLNRAAAIIISGLGRDFCGDQTISTKAPVIDAAGLTAEQVLQEVKERMELIGD